MRVFFKRFLFIGILAATAIVLIGFLNWLHPALDTLSHFRLHVSVGLFIGFLILLFFGSPRIASLVFILGCVGIWFAADGTRINAETRAALPGKPAYKMFQFNLFWLNPKKQLVIDRIMEIDPELISISEASATWEPFLKQLEEDWPYIAHCPEWHVRGGVRIYSKWELDHSNNYCGSYGSFQMTTAILNNGKRITLGSAHPRWPWPASGPKQIDEILPELVNMEPDALVAGDFNATTWSWSIQRFANAGGLDVHPGIGGTWMFGTLPKPVVQLIGLPIDNVMSKGDIRILSVEPLEEMGSDHLPLVINFQIK